MKVVAIYPGRFQPFGPHHKQAYEWLAEQFGKENTFIVTSDKVDGGRSPLSYESKAKIIERCGVEMSNVIKSNNPYKASELLNRFNPNDTVAVYMYSEKDGNRLRYTKNNGQPGYFQPYIPIGDIKPMAEHSYVLICPIFEFDSPSGILKSSTELREFLKSANTEQVESVYGWYDESIFKPFRSKNVNEISSNEVGTKGSVDDGPRFFFRSSEAYKKGSSKHPQVPKLWNVVDFILGDGEVERLDTLYPNGPVPSVSFFPIGNTGAGTDYFKDTTNKKAYQIWKSYVSKLIGTGDEVVDYLGADISKSKNVPINERYNIDTDSYELSYNDLKLLDNYVDRLFAKYDIDVSFSRHFKDRVNDKRNVEPITFTELQNIFKDAFKKHGEYISKLTDDDSRLIKSMSTDINIPFVINFNMDTMEYELVLKTVMRKRNFKSNDPVLKVEQLNEGGGFGRIIHPYEDINLTFKDIKNIIHQLLSGDYKDIEGVYEKVDGQNLLLTYDNGEFLLARNKSTVMVPVPIDGAELSNNKEVQNNFINVAKVISNSLRNVSDDKLLELFNNGKRFLNIEVLFPNSPNVIKYSDEFYIVIIGIVEFDGSGEIVKNITSVNSKLGGLINSNNNSDYNVISLSNIESLNIKNFEELYKEFNQYIENLKSNYDLSDDSKISELYTLLVGKLIDSKFRLNDQLREILIDRWVHNNKSNRINKSTFGEDYKNITNFEKNELDSYLLEIHWLIENIFIKLGIIVANNLNSRIGVDVDATMSNIKSGFKNTISLINSNGDDSDRKGFNRNVKKISKLGQGLPMLSSEGIVFEYNGNMYKLTGVFSQINQILSISKYK